MIDQKLIRIIRDQFTLDWAGIHGAGHGARVRDNGLRLAESTGAKPAAGFAQSLAGSASGRIRSACARAPRVIRKHSNGPIAAAFPIDAPVGDLLPLTSLADSREPGASSLINNYNKNFKDTRDHTRINGMIRSATVRLIDADGTQVGVKPIAEALALARMRGLDLVEVAATAQPPVCKVLPYSKYKYEQDKKERESRKKQKAGLLKELRFRPNIGQHDLDVKIKQIEEFIGAHDKVRITVVFRGREMQHRDLGFKLLMSIQERLVESAAVEQAPMPDRNRLVMTLIPKPH